MSLIVILVICVAILAIAYFSGIEVAFTSANRLNVELKRTQGASGIAFLSSLYDNPSRFIGTNIVGFNFWLVVAVLTGSAGWSLVIDSFQLSKDFVDSIAWLRVIIEILLSWLVVIMSANSFPKPFSAQKQTVRYLFQHARGFSLLQTASFIGWLTPSRAYLSLSST